MNGAPSMARIAGYASAVHATVWASFVVFVLLINPRVGLANPRDLGDPAKLLPALDAHPALIAFPALDGVAGLSLLVVVICGQRIRRDALTRAALAFGIVAAAGFIALSIARTAMLPALADLYAQDQLGTGVFELVTAVHNGMSGGIRLALGVWLILVAVLGLSASALPRWLRVFGSVLGVLNILSAYVHVLAAPNVIVLPIFFAALAVCLLRGTDGSCRARYPMSG